MTDDDHSLVRFEIPADFVVARLLPTAEELAYGFIHGWLRRPDVVNIALAKYEAGVPLAPAEEEVALLLSDEIDRVGDLVRGLAVGDEPDEQRARAWLFLALAWLVEHQESADDLLDAIEMLYADFDHPEELAGFVRYMPQGTGLATTDAASLRNRLRGFVEQGLAECREASEVWSRS